MPFRNNLMFTEVVAKRGQLHDIDHPSLVLCKPKIIPIKSVTLLKIEKMQENLLNNSKAVEKEAVKSKE